MAVIYIVLDCASPTAHNDGAFRTLVSVTEIEYRAGIHLQQAARRAAILGYGGPHHVRELRRLDPYRGLDAPTCDPSDVHAPSMSTRLDELLSPGALSEHSFAPPVQSIDAAHPHADASISPRIGAARKTGANNR